MTRLINRCGAQESANFVLRRSGRRFLKTLFLLFVAAPFAAHADLSDALREYSFCFPWIRTGVIPPIKGRVIDNRTSKPREGISVEVDGRAGTRVVTGKDGRFKTPPVRFCYFGAVPLYHFHSTSISLCDPHGKMTTYRWDKPIWINPQWVTDLLNLSFRDHTPIHYGGNFNALLKDPAPKYDVGDIRFWDFSIKQLWFGRSNRLAISARKIDSLLQNETVSLRAIKKPQVISR